MRAHRAAKRRGSYRTVRRAERRGLTPSLGVLHSVREHITIPVHPIIRPRGGDFYYTDGEFAAMLEDIRLVRELGFPGLVTGVLTLDGDVDMSRMEKIMAAAGPLAVTFHRAFDMCANPFNALKNLADAGVARVLTSGQKVDAAQGLSIIMELIAQGDAPIIMAGAGFAQITCRISSMPEYGKYTVPPESYCLRRCAIAIRGYRCLPIYRRTSILAIG